MKPVHFVESNKTLYAPGRESSHPNVAGVEPLSVWTDGFICVSRWRLTWRERFSALLFGRVWCSMISGGSQPPVALLATRTFFGPVEATSDTP